MSIINKICEAIYAELIRQNTDESAANLRVDRVLVDYPTYMDIKADRHFPHWCFECWDETDGCATHIITIMGHPLVPTYEVTGFDIMLNDGTIAPKAEKDTAQN